jgi:hypothetical protein
MELKKTAALSVINNRLFDNTKDEGLVSLLCETLHFPPLPGSPTIEQLREWYYEYQEFSVEELTLYLCEKNRLDLLIREIKLDYFMIFSAYRLLVDRGLTGCLKVLQNNFGDIDYSVMNKSTIKSLIDHGWDPTDNLGDVVNYDYDDTNEVNEWIIDSLTPSQKQNLHRWNDLAFPIGWRYSIEIRNGEISYVENEELGTEEYDDWFARNAHS